MASTVNINDMADVIMQGLTEFAELATDDMKEAVKHASTTVRKEIKANAPEDTGKYAKSWTAKKLSLIHISEPTRLGMISYAVFCLKKKK